MAGSDDDQDAVGWPERERRSGPAERRAGERRALRLVKSGAAERRRSERRGVQRRDEAAWRQVRLDSAGAGGGGDADEPLRLAALAAREHAEAHYSHFAVGAALETLDGVVVTGCNIENATYGLTLCAERVALVKALSDGHRAFTRIAVVAATASPTPPCGACRQLLWEYCGDIDVILGNLEMVSGRHRLGALLPLPFDRRLLE